MSPVQDDISMAYQCDEDLSIWNIRVQDLFQQKEYYSVLMGKVNHGFVTMIFKQQKDYLLQFTDLSLHFVSEKVKWVREEALSRVIQVEVLEQENIRIESELEYVKNVKDKVTIDQVG